MLAFGQRILLVAFGLSLVALAAELALRARARASDGPAPEVRIHDFAFIDENGVPRFEPFAVGWHRGYGDDDDNLVRLNSLGTPGPEPLGAPEQRIAFIGDSITFNGGVAWERSFLGLATAQLRSSGHPRWEFLNFGFSDGNLDHYLKKLEFEVLPLEPDLVYVGLYLNDSIGIEGSPIPIFADGLPRHAARQPSRSFFVRWLGRRLSLARVVPTPALTRRAGVAEPGRFDWVPRFEAKRYRDDPHEFARLIREARNDWGAAWTQSFVDALRGSLERMRELATSKRVPLVVVQFPVSPQVESPPTFKDRDLPQTRAARVAADLDIPIVDLLPALREAEGPLYRDQCHFNLRGNRVVARVIAADARGRLEKHRQLGADDREEPH